MLELKIILEIALGYILGSFVYQYLIDDLIQGYLKKKYIEKFEKELETLQRPNSLESLFKTEDVTKKDLH